MIEAFLDFGFIENPSWFRLESQTYFSFRIVDFQRIEFFVLVCRTGATTILAGLKLVEQAFLLARDIGDLNRQSFGVGLDCAFHRESPLPSPLRMILGETGLRLDMRYPAMRPRQKSRRRILQCSRPGKTPIRGGPPVGGGQCLGGIYARLSRQLPCSTSIIPLSDPLIEQTQRVTNGRGDRISASGRNRFPNRHGMRVTRSRGLALHLMSAAFTDALSGPGPRLSNPLMPNKYLRWAWLLLQSY